MNEKSILRPYKSISAPLLLTLISLLITLDPNPAFAGTGKKSGDKQGLIPASILRWPENISNYAILVDKSAQRVFVYHRNNLFSPFRVFRCSTGENDGPKSRKNDRKTPEGIYFITNAYEERDLSPIYGIKAFPIDYPNLIDRKQGKGGYGIWFHGTNKPLKPQDTNGCIVLDNPKINEMANYIQINRTPVIIGSKIEMIDPERLQEKKRELENIIQGWRRDWAKKRLDRYMSYYSSRFLSRRKDWQDWKAHKARLAKKYKEIRVEIENLQPFQNDGIVLAKFNQRYSTPVFESYGEKRLYLRQNSNQWKIVGEFFREQKIKRVAQKRPRLSSLEEIERFVSLWKEAWEKKALKAYLSCYDSSFRSRGMDLKAWKRHRRRLNRKYRSLKIGVTDLTIIQLSEKQAIASFKQDYRADGYHDFGLKKIFLIRKGKHWKIKKEQWSTLKRKSRP